MAYNFPDNPTFGDVFTDASGPSWRWNGSGWAAIGPSQVLEAPIDGLEYVRKNAAWAQSASSAPSWASITGKPSTFPPDAHTHAQAEVTGLVAALAGKEPAIAAGIATQYWTGVKTWATLDKAAVGLGNVDNTSDASKPVSTAQAAADALNVLKAGDTMTGPLNLIGGSSSNVSLQFGGGAGGGIYASGSGATYVQNFVVNASVKMLVDQSQVRANSPIRLQDGSAGTPALAFTSDTDTGLYWPGAGQIGIAVDGLVKFWVTTTNINATLPPTFSATTAIPAGGTAGVGVRVSSVSNFGMFFGSGVPTLSAAKGSLYLRSDGSTTNDRMYVNTNGSTTWTAVNTVA